MGLPLTIRTIAGCDWNDVHRLERCVRMASWRWYSVSGTSRGDSTEQRYPRRSGGRSSIIGSPSWMDRMSQSEWSAVAVM